MNVRIKPSHLEGIVSVPSSKSISHRAIICAALSNGKSIIRNVFLSKDVLATIEAMKSLGAKINILKDNILEIEGCYPKLLNNRIFANESGSTLRFLIPIALLQNEEVTFDGVNRLTLRPLDTYFEIFDKMSIKYEHPTDKYLPLKLKGKLMPSTFYVKGDVSSQFITGLLFALPLLDNDSKIIITSKLESKGYIDITIDVLKKFGIDVVFNDNVISIKGNQKYKSRDFTIEGDFSQAAFFLVADMLGANIKLSNLDLNSFQGDKEIINYIKEFGGKIVFVDNMLSVVSKNKKGATISLAQTPDLGPALTVLASVIKDKSHLKDAKRLRIKECDRITCMKEEINKLGGNVSEYDSGMYITGTNLKGGVVDSHNDHRVVMALSMLCQVLNEDLVITNCEAIEKSFPNFFDVLKDIGGNITYE